MENYVRVCLGVMVPLALTQMMDPHRLIGRIYYMIARYYLKMGDEEHPLRISGDLPTYLVIIDNVHWFLMESDFERIKSRDNVLPELSHHFYREMCWLEVEENNVVPLYNNEHIYMVTDSPVSLF